MKYSLRIMPAVVFMLFTITVSAQQEKNNFRLQDLRKLINISSPCISPDGSRIAFIKSVPDWKTDKSKQEIDLIDAASGSIRSLTFNRKAISNLSWSPDGSDLSFLSEDSSTKKPQIYIMPMNGGDPVRITKSKTGVAEYTWSPNGETIAFTAQDTVPNPKEIKHHEDAFKVTANNYMVRAELQPWHLWIVSSKGGKAKQLTNGKFSLQTDQETISPLVWNPDGSSITFQRFPDVWEGNSWHSIIAEIDTSGNKIDTVIKAEGSGQPKYSGSGKIMAFMRARNGDLNNGNAVYVFEDGKIHDATSDLKRNIMSYKWLPGTNDLLLTGMQGTRTVLWKQPVNGKAVQINLGNVDIREGSLTLSKKGILSFIGSTPSHPAELYIMASLNAKPERLTDLNAFVDSLTLSKTESVSWKGPDGFDEDGVLNYPVNFKEGKKYPLVLVIHGGPEWASTVPFSPLTQLLAAKGFFVFQPNYRGSINLGDKYQHAIFRNTGEGPGKDIMAGVNKVIQSGFVDTSRMGISGWSYGGYMTSWLNGYYPDKWKAAVEGAALNDWVMDYTIAYYQTFDLYFFGGSPWTQKYWKIWRDQSPIVLARYVKAPTLILGDAGDPNVPIVNSYEMYHALKDNGVHTEFYVYPADTHFPHDIVRTTDVYKRWIDWLDKYLK